MNAVLPLELRRVTHWFGSHRVLRDVDLHVESGEIVALMGANGAGKTTLINVVLGLISPQRGERCLAGAPAGELSRVHRAAIGWVAHSPQLYPRLDARENLELFVRLRAAAGARSAPIDEVLVRMGLTHEHDQPVATFSRGMLQRLALARALCSVPELLVLDEPFTALDREGRQQLSRILDDERTRGAGILLATHDAEVASMLADRVLRLHGGSIVAQVSRSELTGTHDEGFRARVMELWTN